MGDANEDKIDKIWLAQNRIEGDLEEKDGVERFMPARALSRCRVANAKRRRLRNC